MTVYINTQTLEYPVYQDQIKLAYPNTSFPEPFVPPAAYAPVIVTTPPSYNTITQTVQQAEPQQVSGLWYEVWEVVDLDPQQVQQNEDQAKAANKSQAQALLQQTDWTAPTSIADPVESNPYLANRPAFLNYRSQVRAIAVNPPVTVETWPTMPVEQWAYN